MYNRATQAQISMTIASQRKAIKLYRDAMDCYDSKAKKADCKRQISKCNKMIAYLRDKDAKPSPAEIAKPEEEKPAEVTVDTLSVPSPVVVEEEVVLSVDTNRIVFKYEGGFQKVKVACNFDDWGVLTKPDWISYYLKKDENVLVFEAQEFKKWAEVRRGRILIYCRKKEVYVDVLQNGIGTFNKK